MYGKFKTRLNACWHSYVPPIFFLKILFLVPKVSYFRVMHSIVPLITTFIRNCVVSPACPHCNAPVEDVKHYFLYCPMYAAHRIALFTSAAHLLGDKWLLTTSDKKKIEYFLFGSLDLQLQSNVRLFEQVQSFISHSSRFS